MKTRFTIAFLLALAGCAPKSPSSIVADEFSTCSKKVNPTVIYGPDDRLDLYQIKDPWILRIANSTVALIEDKNLKDLGNGYTEIIAPTLADKENMCTTEPFASQVAPVYCSGALVGKDLVMTAGHCMSSINHCDHIRIVFGVHVTSSGVQPKMIPTKDVYKCKKIIASQEPLRGGDQDYGVVRINKKVKDRAPLPIRRSGKIPDGAKIFSMGHPLGVPTKYVPNAIVRSNNLVPYFISTLDTYIHDSGSPVFNAETGYIEGILVRGEPDFVAQGSCKVSKRCKETECLGQSVNRLEQAIPFIPAVDLGILDPIAEPSPAPTPSGSPSNDNCP